MNTVICTTLFVCVTLTYASAWPAPEEGGPVALVQPAVAVAVNDEILEGAEQRGFGGGGGFGGGRGGFGGGGGGGFGGRGFGGGGGFGGGRGGFGGGFGGGRRGFGR